MMMMSTNALCRTASRSFLVAIALCAWLAIPNTVSAQTHRLVWTNSPSPGVPYATWDTAARDIQTAVDAAVAANGDEVIVRAGVYDTGGTLVRDCTNRVFINRTIVVRSEDNDSETTIIRGAWDPVGTNGPAAVRCVYMVNGASLIGFTLTNGATVRTDDSRSNCGGGVFAGATSVISNCVIVGNTAWGDLGNGVGGGGLHEGRVYDSTIKGNRIGTGRNIGGGAFSGTLYNCLITENVAEWGAGAFRSTLYGCVVSNNTAIKVTGYTIGGGISGWSSDLTCHAYDSVIVGNSADRGAGIGYYSFASNCTIVQNQGPVTPGQYGYGGGAFGANLVDCTVVSNRSTYGGGAQGGNSHTNCVFAYNVAVSGGGGVQTPSRAVNCLFYGNRAQYGGGVYLKVGSVVESCTLVGNTSISGGGGLYFETAGNALALNSIVYANSGSTTPNYRDNFAGVEILFTNSLTTPAKAGWHASNLAVDPKFVTLGSGYGTNHVAGDYRLRGTSPCLNAGANQAWMAGALDLDGNPRLDKVAGTVDMGCYEYVYSGTLLLLR